MGARDAEADADADADVEVATVEAGAEDVLVTVLATEVDEDTVELERAVDRMLISDEDEMTVVGTC